MTPSERVESTPVGRAVISGVVVFVLLTLLASNLPGSELRHQLTKLVDPVRDGLGLDQSWGVFAPNPRRQTQRVEAELEYADGSVGIWEPGSGDRVVTSYRTYRWRKFAEFLRGEGHTTLWVSTAAWLARAHERNGRHPVRVTLVRYWRVTPPPGEDPGPEHRWRSYPFFTLEVTPDVLAGEL